MKKAIVFGSSGFVGSHLLSELLSSSDYEHVTAVVRKPLNISHPKLKTLIDDGNSLFDLTGNMLADEIFIALGATKKTSPKRADYYKVDHDYPVLAAKMAKEKGARSVFLLSAVGASPDSSVFYVRTKGETERDIIALDFEHTHIFRLSMIMGNRKENRSSLEQILIKAWSVLNPLLVGRADRYRGLTGADIAKAVSNSARNQSEKLRIYHWKEMNDLLQRRFELLMTSTGASWVTAPMVLPASLICQLGGLPLRIWASPKTKRSPGDPMMGRSLYSPVFRSRSADIREMHVAQG